MIRHLLLFAAAVCLVTAAALVAVPLAMVTAAGCLVAAWWLTGDAS